MSNPCHRFWKCYNTITFLLTFDKVHNPLRLPRGTTSKRPKVVRTPGVFYILTSICASRHNGMHFFNSSTSKSGPNVKFFFLAFSLASVLRATTVCTFSTSQLPKVVRNPSVFTFWLRNVLRATMACTFSTSQLPKVVRHPSVFTFWLRNVLRATMACTFSTAQLPKVLRTCGALYILTCKCSSRHNGVQFFISHLARWLGTRRFSEPTFRPSGATNHWKNTVFRDFPTFLRTCIFFLLALSSLIFSLLLFSSLWLFPSLLFICPYCRKFDF